jgi:hypothetical protein
VTSYAVRRPDGNWALMLVNRDESNPHAIRVAFEDSDKRRGFFSGPVAVTSFGSEQYEWKNDGPNSHADPDGPPIGFHVNANASTIFTLPKASITVLRGHVEGLTK